MFIELPAASEVRMVTVLDPHFSPQTTPMRKTDWLEETLDAWTQIVTFAASVEAHLILVAGDIFHLKTSSRNPHWFTNKVLKAFKESKTKIAGIGGNHDLAFGSLISLWNQPIGGLVLAEGMHLLDFDPIVLKANGFSVKVAGCSYDHAKAEATRALRRDGANFLVGVGHFWFGPKSTEFFGEQVYGPDHLNDSEVDAYVIGHHHEDQGIQKSQGKTYFVHGSMNRTGMHQDDMIRKPSCGLMKITKAGIEGTIVRLKVKPSEELFDVVKREEIKQEEAQLEEFVSALATQGITWTDPAELVATMPLSDEVRLRARAYLKAAEEASESS